MRNIFYFIKKFVLSFFILFGFNFFAINFNLLVPINFITTFIVYLLGIPGLVVLILFKMIVL